MDLVHPLAEQYAVNYASPEDPLIAEVGAFTMAQHPHHHMLSGHVQGKLLEMISWMIRPRRILEIGTFTGYSALCLAKGLTADGELHTIELRQEDAARARTFFNRSPQAHQLISHTGAAKDIIPTLSETWDLVFIDADKPGYTEYFNLVLPKVKQNGFILADNIFFHGQVFENPVTGKSALGIQAFNDMIRERQDIEKTILSIRDGLYLIRKL